ncbi:immunoglobulin lambda-1 light chain-like [Scyliorhinus canicula]|uniref:immunoglobulin lambda-1 light chain-like n=1 Tax=Scyliorhinus canicula TaxID=7830 RepID=UPI0018F73691|nr:immunoglobulin lambda-1 light chain-like [Scyliorhinus canicula]
MLSTLLKLSVIILLTCSACGDMVHQWPPALVAMEGKAIEFNCNQNETVRDNMSWYRQIGRGGLIFIGYFYRAGRAEYEKGFKTGFVISRTMDEKMSTLKLEAVKLTDAAVYYCAVGDGTHNYEAYFGTGTKVVVLDRPLRDPKITLFDPSPEEIQDKEKATVVCTVIDFYPDNIQILWFVDDNVKPDNDPNIQTDLTSIGGPDSYSISSRLRFDQQTWALSKTVECKVNHYSNGSDPTTFSSKLTVNARICGISKEVKMQGMGTAKLTYLIVFSKSILYAIFVSIFAWKAKTSYSKRFD